MNRRHISRKTDAQKREIEIEKNPFVVHLDTEVGFAIKKFLDQDTRFSEVNILSIQLSFICESGPLKPGNYYTTIIEYIDPDDSKHRRKKAKLLIRVRSEEEIEIMDLDL